MCLKMASPKCQPFCLSLNVLTGHVSLKRPRHGVPLLSKVYGPSLHWTFVITGRHSITQAPYYLVERWYTAPYHLIAYHIVLRVIQVPAQYDGGLLALDSTFSQHWVSFFPEHTTILINNPQKLWNTNLLICKYATYADSISTYAMTFYSYFPSVSILFTESDFNTQIETKFCTDHG